MHTSPNPSILIHMIDYAIPSALTHLAGLVKTHGATLYAVGGLPRNALLGVPPSDMDLCSRLTPEEFISIMEKNSVRVIPKALKFGTVEAHVGGRVFEHTTFRADVYGRGGTHRPEAVRFSQTLEEDAYRRDFRCNALYLDILSGTLHDPTGGVADIKKRRLSATTKNPEDILRDDGLRVLRLARFAAELGFEAEKRTWKAACACVHGLADIAFERKRDELAKILLSDERYPTLPQLGESPVLRGLKLLYHMGALPYLIPELLEGDQVPQRQKYHAFDVLLHNLHTCAAAPPTLILRLAGLLHDVGKPAALLEKGLSLDAGGGKPLTLAKGVTPMLGHDRLGAQISVVILERLRFPKDMIEQVRFLIEHHMYDLNGMAKQSTLRARFAQLGYERASLLCDLREADVMGSGRCDAFSMRSWRDVLARMRAQGTPFSEKELNCTGADIMAWLNIEQGSAVGQIKRRLLSHCARHPQDNTPERLKRVVRGMKGQKSDL